MTSAMKKLAIVTLLLLSCFLSQGQETLKIMQYNLLHYGVNSSFCTSSNNNVNNKDGYIRTILSEYNPDLLTVNEFGSDPSLPERFLNNNLNINGVNYWKTTETINHASSDLVNAIFYDSRKMTLTSHKTAQNYIRDIDVYKLYFNTESLEQGDTIFMYCVIAHLKAGTGSDNEEKRKFMAQNTMNYLRNYCADANVLIMGDFNLYSADEDAYKILTNSSLYPNSYFIDPIEDDGVGDWNNNGAFARYHTQSTNASGNSCRTGGGMDDRFDFIMMSENIRTGRNGVRYVEDSYMALGQDGNHFNRSINASGNDAVPQEVANALYYNSDHLPITMRISIDDRWDVEDISADIIDFKMYPNPASNNLHVSFKQQSHGKVEIKIFNALGQTMLRDHPDSELGEQHYKLDIETLTQGIYLLQIITPDGTSHAERLIIR